MARQAQQPEASNSSPPSPHLSKHDSPRGSPPAPDRAQLSHYYNSPAPRILPTAPQSNPAVVESHCTRWKPPARISSALHRTIPAPAPSSSPRHHNEPEPDVAQSHYSAHPLPPD